MQTDLYLPEKRRRYNFKIFRFSDSEFFLMLSFQFMPGTWTWLYILDEVTPSLLTYTECVQMNQRHS